MNGIVVVGHNHFAEGVVSAGEMILGPQEHVKYVCLTEGVDAFSKQLNETLDEAFGKYDSVVVLADAKGGTPFNQSLRYKMENAKDNMYIVAGVNLPLLMELALRLGEDDIEKVLADVIATGQSSIELESVEDDDDDDDDIV